MKKPKGSEELKAALTSLAAFPVAPKTNQGETMSNEAFEKWASQFDTKSNEYIDKGADGFFSAGYKYRQPEIDALIHDNGNMLKAIAEYDKENAELKSEVIRLRGMLYAPKITLVMKREIERLQEQNKRLEKDVERLARELLEKEKP